MSQIEELIPFLEQWVIVTDKQGQKWPGHLQFVGINEHFPSWGLVCTVGRVPGIRINNINNIKLIENA